MTLTIFTPTFNRAYTLPRLYHSLLEQSNREFCWLIVDDGSTDETEELIKGFIDESKIIIRYYRQINSGKHVAHNKALELCDTELFVCVDSDDWLSPNAVDTIINNNRCENNILGLYLRRVNSRGENIASDYPPHISYVGITDLYHNFKFCGDTVIVLRTALVKNIKFPVFNGEKFLTERIWYNMLNDIGPMKLCEEGIYYCEYLLDGLSRNLRDNSINNPYGTALDYLCESYYGSKLIYKLKNSIMFYRYVKEFRLDTELFQSYKQASVLYRILGQLMSNELVYKVLCSVKNFPHSIR